MNGCGDEIIHGQNTSWKSSQQHPASSPGPAACAYAPIKSKAPGRNNNNNAKKKKKQKKQYHQRPIEKKGREKQTNWESMSLESFSRTLGTW